MSTVSGKLFLELACWGIGLLLIAVYFDATVGFENERREGIEVFARAQAAAESTSEAELVVLPQDVDRAEPPGQLDAKLDSLPVAVLRMPGLDLEVPVFSDISERNLSRGAGWIPGTASPNAGGNMAIAAHRDQYFRALKDAAVGDLLELESLSGQRNYKVTSITVVQPEELWPLDASDMDTVTLVTCYPFYYIGSAPQRYIVQAVAVN